MDKHPFFMKEPPKPGQELNPLLEGLQALKYDPNENEPEGNSHNSFHCFLYINDVFSRISQFL